MPVRLIAGIRLHEKASLDKVILSSDVKEVCQGSNDSSAVYKYAVCNSQKEKYLIRNARNKNMNQCDIFTRWLSSSGWLMDQKKDVVCV